jgi:putative transcriptional regulator
LLQIGGADMASGFKSLKGQLLLDGGKLRGSFFHRTVVLICQHDAEGAFGLVLNRSSGGKVRELIEAEAPEGLQGQPVFLGGPVQPSALSYLHTDTFLLNANVIPNVSLGHSLESLVEIAGAFSGSQQLRVFAGYAGWSPGQLDDEMRRKAWLTYPASIDLIFHPQPDQLWPSILRKKGWQYRLLAQGPEDLSWN